MSAIVFGGVSVQTDYECLYSLSWISMPITTDVMVGPSGSLFIFLNIFIKFINSLQTDR